MSNRFISLFVTPVLAFLVIAAGCVGEPRRGDAFSEEVGSVSQPDQFTPAPANDPRLVPTCTNGANITEGSLAHEHGTCASGDGFTFDDAVIACGGNVKYFEYFCSDFPAKLPYLPTAERAWTAYVGCCSDGNACNGLGPDPSICTVGSQSGVCQGGTCVGSAGALLTASPETRQATGIAVWEWAPVADGASQVISGLGDDGRELFRQQATTVTGDLLVVAIREGGSGPSQFFQVIQSSSGRIVKQQGTETLSMRRAVDSLTAANLGGMAVTRVATRAVAAAGPNQCVSCMLTSGGCGVTAAGCVASQDSGVCASAVMTCGGAVNVCISDPCGFVRDDEAPSCGLSGAEGAGGNPDELRECIPSGHPGGH